VADVLCGPGAFAPRCFEEKSNESDDLSRFLLSKALPEIALGFVPADLPELFLMTIHTNVYHLNNQLFENKPGRRPIGDLSL